MESRRKGHLAALIAGLALAVPTAALAAFPDPSDPNPRVGTPNDPDFDHCEADDETTPGVRECSSYFKEDFRLFGFSPDSANQVPNPGGSAAHAVTGTRYEDCGQLDEQGKALNRAAEPGTADDAAAECLQIGGIRADAAWKYSDGSPNVSIAILDTGIRWQERDLVTKVALNEAELPLPQEAGGADCGAYDCNGDGAVNVTDYAGDPRVADTAGDEESDDILDASDLIATFSAPSFSSGGIEGGSDDDGNGYVDDIAGWDFFDDDNDPYDASSCCSAEGHGSDRAEEAAAETDNAIRSPGVCPDCQIIPLRVWDTFVVPTDNYAMATVYAADNGASVVEGAVGGLTNTQFARRAFEYADSKGVALTLVSSDINSANHNYPTNYNEAIYVGGSLPDTAPNEGCSGPGGLPGLPELGGPPEDFADGCARLFEQLGQIGVEAGDATQPITTSFFRNANLTQYGGKADVVLMGATGSANTGQAAGAAGLLASYGREEFPGDPLSGNEIRQLLTMTAEDVRPLNTGAIGQPDRANIGWDSHFGYGRVNLAGAMDRIENDRVPPEAQIDAPDWFTPVNVDRVPAEGLLVEGRAAAPHSATGVGDWELEYACGQDATDDSFQAIPGGGIDGTGPVDGALGRIPKSTLQTLATTCDGSVAADAGRPAGTTANPWPADPYPSPDPERHAFQIRLTVHAQGDATNFGRYRKTLFGYEDDGNLDGWPKPVGSGSDPSARVTGSGGEAPPRLYDLNGDNELDVILPTSSGELHVLDSSGEPLASFNQGQPVTTQPLQLASAGRVPAGLPVPRESLRAPAIGDIDGDRAPEIVATAGEHVYAWNDDGSVAAGFPVRLDPSLSEPCVPGVPKPCFDAADRAITEANHIKRGFIGSPALADLGGDSRLDIVVGALDQHLYAWDGDGQLLPAHPAASAKGDGRYPVKLDSPGAPGAEIVNSPAIAELDGDPKAEVVNATNEVIGGDPSVPDSFPDPRDLLNLILTDATGSNPVYAIDGDGRAVPGWPVSVGVASGDLLPLVLPGHDAAVVDQNGDGRDEVTVSAGTSVIGTGGTRLVNSDGSTRAIFANGATNGADQGAILNLADYPSIGNVLGGDPGSGGFPQVFKAGLTVNGVVNLLAVNQNLPFNHVVQGWSLGPSGSGLDAGQPVPGYPRATDDFQLVSQPAIARVSGSGPARQVLHGTGLYQLHAYGPGGVEPAGSGWPKFTGGWTQATPAVGDADGDGSLDVVALTREGWSFLWATDAPACGGTGGEGNAEWWTFHHDEFGSANYGTDARPPGTPERLTAEGAEGDFELSWTAPGDDWLCGDASSYEIRVANGPIDEPSDGSAVVSAPAVAGSGETQTDALDRAEAAGATHVAVLYSDEAGNWGRVASAPLERSGGGGTPPGGGTPGETHPPGPGADPNDRDCENRISGTDGRDRLEGSDASDRIRGLGGGDRIAGAGAGDCIAAGRGKDRAGGGAGDDRITGGVGRDRIDGGGGADKVRAGGDGDRDRIDCGPGRDTVIADDLDRIENCERVERK